MYTITIYDLNNKLNTPAEVIISRFSFLVKLKLYYCILSTYGFWVESIPEEEITGDYDVIYRDIETQKSLIGIKFDKLDTNFGDLYPV